MNDEVICNLCDHKEKCGNRGNHNVTVSCGHFATDDIKQRLRCCKDVHDDIAHGGAAVCMSCYNKEEQRANETIDRCIEFLTRPCPEHEHIVKNMSFEEFVKSPLNRCALCIQNQAELEKEMIEGYLQDARECLAFISSDLVTITDAKKEAVETLAVLGWDEINKDIPPATMRLRAIKQIIQGICISCKDCEDSCDYKRILKAIEGDYTIQCIQCYEWVDQVNWRGVCAECEDDNVYLASQFPQQETDSAVCGEGDK